MSHRGADVTDSSEKEGTAGTQILLIPAETNLGSRFCWGWVPKGCYGSDAAHENSENLSECARARGCREKITFPRHSMCSASAIACFLACHNS